MGMTLGRFLSGVFATKFSSRQLVKIGQGIVTAAILILLLPFPTVVSGGALFLIGLGNGPIFPNMLYLTPEHFGKDHSQAAMGLQMVLSYIGILCAPTLFGILAQTISMSLFPVYLAVLCVIMVSSTCLAKRTAVDADPG